MDFGVNKTSVEVIKEGAFGGTYFRDIYSGVTGKWYKKSWKEFDQLKDIDQKYYCSSYYHVSVNKYGVKCGPSLRFLENKGWINKMDPYGWFQQYLMMMMMMVMMMMNSFCGMVNRRKAFSLISSRDHCQRSSPSRISDMSRARFEPAQTLSSGLVE